LVGPTVNVTFGGNLLRAHIERRADGDSDTRGAPISGQEGGLCDPKIRDKRLALSEKDVVRFHIAVNDPHAVRVIQRARGLSYDVTDLQQGQLLLARYALAQGFSDDKRRHVIQQSIGFSRVEQRENVRMLETGDDPDFAEKPRSYRRVGQFFADYFDCHATVVAAVTGLEDRTRRTRSDDPADLVRPNHGRAQAAAKRL
jgi:hypothetical protein